MKVVRLAAENFKRLTAVEIAPSGNLVEIRGKNGAGKSSLLDAIYGALAGADALPSKPIRRGAETARIQLDLGEITVTRKFGPGDKTSVVVEAASGARFPSPQRMLDNLIGAIAFDPFEFTRMEPKKQLETLRGLVKLDVDLDALDGLNKRDYDARTEANREAAKLRGQASGIHYPEDQPAEPLDVEVLTRALADAGRSNAEITLRAERRERVEQRVREFLAQAAEIERAIPERIAELERAANIADGKLEQRIADLERQIETLRTEREQAAAAAAEAIVSLRQSSEGDAAECRRQAEELQAQIDRAEPLPEPVITDDLIRQIEEAQQVNSWIGERQRRFTIEAEAEAIEQRAARLTEAMASRSATKARAIAEAKMPVPGLSFGDGEVLFNDIPFDQASGAEKIRVSVAIAMAANPRLRVICVRDGSLLDEDSLRELAAAVTEHDYQCWVELVGDDAGVGIIIEDGSVAAQRAPAHTAKQQASLI